jgi:L-malate glycosyltransferase
LKKILYFSEDYTPHDYRFLSALAETDYQVYYARFKRGCHQAEDRPIPAKIKQIQWAGGRGPFRWRHLPRLVYSLRKVIRSIKPDLIHAGPIQTCAFIAVLTGFHPILTMSWGFDLMQDVNRNIWWKIITHYTLRHSTVFISDAEITRQKAINHGMNSNRTVVFPWGVDIKHFAPFASRHSNTDAFILFCNRSWEPRYGVDVLVRAFVKVAQQHKDISLLLLGSGSREDEIRQIIETSSVSKRVTFAGYIAQVELPHYYQKADLYISPSHIDGSSVSLMEALASGLPCLVSDIPANQEWITDGINGWLFPDGNVDALAKSILDVYEHRKNLIGIKKAARRTAEQRADWKKNFNKLLDAYEMALNAYE